ncbi:MAG: TlpA disulfide reductase family protein [Ilumatobacteraceae bacterium]
MSQRRGARMIAMATLVVMVGLLLVLVNASPNPSENADSPLLGQPAPAIETTTLDNKQFNLARRKGSWVVLNFFNSTCVPCRNEHPLLLEFAATEALATDKAELYTVINDDSDEAVAAYFQTFGGDWPKLRDQNGSIAISFGIAKVPETWIIDPNGYVRLRIAGQLSDGLLEEQLSALRSSFG